MSFTTARPLRYPQRGSQGRLWARGRAVDERPYGAAGRFMGIYKPFCKLAVPARRGGGTPPYAKFGLGRKNQPFCKLDVPARRGGGTPPYARFWIGRKNQPFCIGRCEGQPIYQLKFDFCILFLYIIGVRDSSGRITVEIHRKRSLCLCILRIDDKNKIVYTGNTQPIYRISPK